ncbi:tRNA (adenine57-N1/adenine58-N1)-methyltransferase [Naumannella halotolerans]|uniref:tRNA (adenine(58)-N(1))-methyltransferase TrmI n=1 Tax=Naumannella halotolerans TaxID=993414 RepID=A0A4R7J998_9ACTN|nr:tRNA (adenine57-N1/adenine58-N1)-methyltransferase [Naumannella halotolerans]
MHGDGDPELLAARRGPLRPGERVTLHDPKGRRHSVLLEQGKAFHSAKGYIAHDDLIGGPEGVVAETTMGVSFLVLRPQLAEFSVTMKRGAAVIYPKDAAQIVQFADVFPGARVAEAGVGSGALTLSLLRALGHTGRLYSYERREDFAEIARKNVVAFYGAAPANWQLRVGSLPEDLGPEPLDAAILDMLAPWECVDALAETLQPGGVLLAYVATTTQLGRFVETLRTHTGFTEPEANEITIRPWHAQGLAIRPGHTATGHTGFLVHARRLAPGVRAPRRKRRPAPGAYGPDYVGPRPPGVEEAPPDESPE